MDTSVSEGTEVGADLSFPGSLGAVLGAKLEMREPLRIPRRTADFALTLDAGQTLPRIENHPAPLVELLLEQRQQRALAGRLDAIRREYSSALEIEVISIQTF